MTDPLRLSGSISHEEIKHVDKEEDRERRTAQRDEPRSDVRTTYISGMNSDYCRLMPSGELHVDV